MASHRRITAATAKSVSVEGARAFLNVDHRDDDELISSLIVASERWVESRYGLAIMSQTWRLTLDSFSLECHYLRDGIIRLARPPFGAVSSLSYLDTAGASQSLTGSAYRVSDEGLDVRIEPAAGTSWPSTYCVAGAVTLDHTAGSSTAEAVSPVVRLAVKDCVADRYENREMACGPLVIAGVDALMAGEGILAYA